MSANLASSLHASLQVDLGYNATNKAQFKKLAMSTLRKLAKTLMLNKEDYSVRFNAGGIAVSGEATLHHKGIYIVVSQFFGSKTVLYRTCTSQDDFVGGVNNYANALDLLSDSFIAQIQRMIED